MSNPKPSPMENAVSASDSAETDEALSTKTSRQMDQLLNAMKTLLSPPHTSLLLRSASYLVDLLLDARITLLSQPHKPAPQICVLPGGSAS